MDLGSFSKAAEEFFLAQASVSERVATLESLVGTKLLDRLGRQVVPTKAGELLYKHAQMLMDMKRNASLEMQAFLGKKKGGVQMGGSTIPGEYILPVLLKDFHQKYPSIIVSLAISDSAEIQKQVLNGKLELGITGSKNPHKSLLHNDLWQDELVLAVPATHRFAEKEEISLTEIANEPFIARQVGSGTLKIFNDYLRKARFKGFEQLNRVAYFGSSMAVKEGIKAGLGISILSYRAFCSEIAAGTLKALKIQGLSMERRFYLVRDRRRTLSPLCQTLVDFLLQTKEG